MRIKALNTILNLFFPPRCIFCGEPLSPEVEHRVCSHCANNLPYCGAYNRCRRCGIPIDDEAGRVCRECQTTRRHTTRITSSFLYTGTVKDAIVAFKKEENADNGRELSMYVAGMVRQDFGGEEIDFVISVPPRIKNATEERFDQAAYLAKKVALKLGVPYLKGAMRQKRKVQKQSSLLREERYLNLKDVFEVRKIQALRNKTVLLIDDVSTTGTTLEECAKALKKNGVHRLLAATAARTVSGM